MYRIVIIDDHPIVRHGIAMLINQEMDMEVCGEAENATSALTTIKETTPDLIIVDISLEDTDGLELIKNVKGRYPELSALVVSMHDEGLYAERALRAGAKGYIMKHEATEVVVDAIRKVMGGEIYVSNRMASNLMHKLVGGGLTQGPATPLETLTDRELEVFLQIGNGKGTRDIAKQLHLSVKTIESHKANIKKKLNLKNATELVQHAFMYAQKEGTLEEGTLEEGTLEEG